jgi:hypothetical protein
MFPSRALLLGIVFASHAMGAPVDENDNVQLLNSSSAIGFSGYDARLAGFVGRVVPAVLEFAPMQARTRRASR